MERIGVLLFSILFFAEGCCKEIVDGDTWDNRSKNIFASFNDGFIQIMSSTDKDASQYDNALLNFFNIIQENDSLYYLYYSCFGKNDNLSDSMQHLCFAYSKNGTTWVREIPKGVEAPYYGTNVIFMNNIIEAQVFKVQDNVYPYRLIGNNTVNGRQLCLYKSKNGIHFDEASRKVLIDSEHDTQVSCIVRDNTIKIYVRMWAGDIRQLGTIYIDLDGNILSPLMRLPPSHPIYQASASVLDEHREILFPTFFDNRYGDDSIKLLSYIVENENIIYKIGTNINNLREDEEKWMVVAPGLITINGAYHIAYCTRTISHDSRKTLEEISSVFKLAKITLR